MIVSELIELLQECDQDAEVLLCLDESAEEVVGCEMIQEELVINDDGQIGIPELNEDLKDIGFSDADVVEDGADCIILCP